MGPTAKGEEMHRSRLMAIMIDCSEDTVEAGTQFWSRALGLTPVGSDDPASPYVDLQGSIGSLDIGMQRVRDASRTHLDIETDDVEAEVRRLEKLGGRRREYIANWWVMEDPCGQLFCVVPWRERSAEAPPWNEWPES
jgi:hypothetical protein